MPRKASTTLTEAEQRLMEVLWERGPGTVAAVTEALPARLGLAYNTVLTTLRILERKGYVRHSRAVEGRAFVYRAVVGREQAARSAVSWLVRRFFDDSREALVLNLLRDERLDEAELARIRALLAAAAEERPQ